MEGKVLFTASTYSHIVNFHLPYLEWFQERGWEVHVGCGGARVEIPWADEVIDLPLKKSMLSGSNWRAARELRRRIEGEGYDLICTHTALASFFTRYAVLGKGERPRVVNMVHGYLFDDETPVLKRSVLLGAERLMAKETDLVVTMNRWDDEAARRYRLGREVVHIPGVGVDYGRLEAGAAAADRAGLRRAHGIREDAFVIVYGAEFSKRKSQGVLIQALSHLREEAVLVLAGDGAERAGCQRLAEELGVGGRVVFPGQVKGMGAWYAAADAAASASRSEGLPFNVMEAQHMGLPVAASDVKGHRDLIEEGETGLLYPYGDAEACAQALGRLMESRPLRERLGRQGRESAERFALPRVLPQVAAVYETLLPADRTAKTAAHYLP